MTISIRTILVPLSFDEPSAAALDYAIELGRRLGATVHLVHVVDFPAVTPPEAVGLAAPEIYGQIERSARDELARVVDERRDQGVALASSLRSGSAAAEIVALAHELPADLVVIGTHGRRGVAHALLGSVAEKVVRTCQVPVLTVHGHRERASRAA